jgi:hypothetical protein
MLFINIALSRDGSAGILPALIPGFHDKTVQAGSLR